MARVFLTRSTMISPAENVVLTVVGWPTWLNSKKLFSTFEFRIYSSQFQSLCLMKNSSETLQNLPYFWNMKSENQHSFFRFSFHATLLYSLMNALVYVDIDQGPGHSLGEKIK